MLCDVLPVPYFHVVFTLPATLSTLVLANRSALYGLLFRAAWQALKELAADPEHLGASVGAVLVLHTWGQNLHHHPHVHGVVPGGGLSADGTRWVPTRSPRYLLCAKALSRKFRGKFLAGLKRLWRTGKLKLGGPLAGLADELAFERWLTPLYAQDWVVYIQPPPKSCQGPEAVLKYLARYVAGAAISDHRLVSHKNGQVRFWGKNYRKGRKRQILPLSGVEFVRRWMIHVLPPGFVRVRYYGLLANTQRRAQVARCRQLLSSQDGGGGDPCLPSRPAPPAAIPAEAAAPACPVCGLGRLWLLRGRGHARPSRGEILSASPFAPPLPRPAVLVSSVVSVPAGQDSS
jgi:Putative transposase